MVGLGKITRNLYCKRELRILVSGRLKTSSPSPKGPFFFLLFCYLGSAELSVEASSAVSTRRPSKTSVVTCGRPKRHLAVAGLQACVSEWASCRSNAFDLSPSGSVSSFESVITCVWLRSPSCVGPGGARRKEGTLMLHRVEKVVGTGVPRVRSLVTPALLTPWGQRGPRGCRGPRPGTGGVATPLLPALRPPLHTDGSCLKLGEDRPPEVAVRVERGRRGAPRSFFSRPPHHLRSPAALPLVGAVLDPLALEMSQ